MALQFVAKRIPEDKKEDCGSSINSLLICYRRGNYISELNTCQVFFFYTRVCVVHNGLSYCFELIGS